MPRSRFEASRVQIIFAEDDCVFREIATPAIERVGIPEQNGDAIPIPRFGRGIRVGPWMLGALDRHAAIPLRGIQGADHLRRG
mmetsp:Transcript_30857/g.78122  ORF Transcript_30857/g.78122 Transcript_30857/m.78122 type:complete len:83 (-) Transcript_30857:60-308(-)